MSSYFSALAGAAAAVAVTGVNSAGVIAATTTAMVGKEVARHMGHRVITHNRNPDAADVADILLTAIAAASAQASQFILTPLTTKGCFFAIGVGKTWMSLNAEQVNIHLTQHIRAIGNTALIISGNLLLANTASVIAAHTLGIADDEGASAIKGTLAGMTTVILVASGIDLYNQRNNR